MADMLERLRAELGGDYELERELGRGGMSTVFLARDRRHARPVAIKVLDPEFAIALGGERFLREVRFAAGLSHPHIVPVFDSGAGGGLLWFVMPAVPGESLRARLDRDGALPVRTALRIARQVAQALQFAHERGIVHRDIKPENILLADDNALVTDFGIAHASADDAAGGGASDSRLTAAGLVLGTPLYMSPEQSQGREPIDGRADVYSLGCVLYEMLAGRPPFPRGSFVELARLHAERTAAKPSTIRTELSLGIDRLVAAAIAKRPDDRYASAAAMGEALDLAIDAVARSGANVRAPSFASGSARRRRVQLTAGLVVLVAVAAVAAVRSISARSEASPLSANVVTVLPFRVGGADPALAYLREGMVDLLAAKLGGDQGPRAADPRAALAAWRRAGGGDDREPDASGLVSVARSLGSDRLLLGSVVGTTAHVMLSATLRSLTDGSERQATVQGPADSLPQLVDALAAQLLAIGAGEGAHRLRDVTSTSLPALRAYLSGRAQYRRGRYADALGDFTRALDEDSTFALAALGARLAAGWINSAETSRATRRAWALKDRLGARDRAIVIGLAGPRFPAYSSEEEVLRAWEQAVAGSPDVPEPWYELGDELFHAGAQVGVADAEVRAAQAFKRALALDSTFAAPLGHLVELAVRAGNTAESRHYGDLYLASDSAADAADFTRWRLAIALGNASALSALRARFAQMTPESLRRIVVSAQLDAIPGDDAERAATQWLVKHRDPGLRWFALLRTHALALNRGRVADARSLVDSLTQVRPGSRAPLRLRLEDAMFGGGDPASAEAAAQLLAPAIAAPFATTAEGRGEQFADLCAVGVWFARRGDSRLAHDAMVRLRQVSVAADPPETQAQSAWCAIAIEAAATPANAAARQRYDSLLMTGPRPLETSLGTLFRTFVWGNLLASQLHERAGDLRGALAAVRRHPYHGAGTEYLATAFRDEGRFTTQVGDFIGARRAYEAFIALRGADAAASSDVATVRAALERLPR